MVPYTIDAVNALRNAARSGTPAKEIRHYLGWSNSMMARVCREHGIALVIPQGPPPSLEPPRMPPQRLTDPIAPYPKEVARFIAKLTARQVEIFRILRGRANTGDGWVTSVDLAETAIGAGTRSICKSAASLARRLERIGIGYRIEARTGKGGGYRLVFEAPAP